MNEDQSYCTFSICGAICGVPVTLVHEVVCDQPITPVPLAHWSVRGLINLRGQILSVIDIARLMGLTATDTASPHGRYHVIAEVGEELISLSVDEMGPVVSVQSDQREVPPSNLDPAAAQVIVAVARLTETLVLLVDLDRIADMQTQASNQADNERF